MAKSVVFLATDNQSNIVVRIFIFYYEFSTDDNFTKLILTINRIWFRSEYTKIFFKVEKKYSEKSRSLIILYISGWVFIYWTVNMNKYWLEAILNYIKWL